MCILESLPLLCSLSVLCLSTKYRVHTSPVIQPFPSSSLLCLQRTGGILAEMGYSVIWFQVPSTGSFDILTSARNMSTSASFFLYRSLYSVSTLYCDLVHVFLQCTSTANTVVSVAPSGSGEEVA